MKSRTVSAPIRIGLVQFRPEKAAVDLNLEAIRSTVESRGSGHDILLFPETALSGYFVEGGVAEVAVSAADLATGLGRASAEMPDLAIGFYERWRGHLYNSIAYLTPTEGSYEPQHIHRKMFLPTYGVFQEGRFVEAGHRLRAFDTRFGRLGMLVCEEAWHSLSGTILALGGAELILIASASPARDFHADASQDSGVTLPANLRRWDRLAPGIAAEHGVFVAVAQLVGSEGGKLFAGGSLIAAPSGSIVARGELMKETLISAQLDPEEVHRERAQSPLLADLEAMLPHLSHSLKLATLRGAPAPDADGIPALSGRSRSLSGTVPMPGDTSVLELDSALVEEALVEFIREEFVRQRGFKRAVIGLSGGVDSSVSLYLACKALGAENVRGFRLPYRTSSEDSLEHARLILDATGAEGRTIDITAAVDGYAEEFEEDLSPERRGNLAARLRAVILFDQSAKWDALPIGTGNKSERLLGYYTWHADDSPPINPLGDLFKTQVWALARHLGVPGVIVDKPASADLIRGVHDEDELGISYPKADLVLHWFLKGYQPEELIRRGFVGDEVELVWRRLNQTHWKRRLPTVAMLSSSAIGEFYLRPVDY